MFSIYVTQNLRQKQNFQICRWKLPWTSSRYSHTLTLLEAHTKASGQVQHWSLRAIQPLVSSTDDSETKYRERFKHCWPQSKYYPASPALRHSQSLPPPPHVHTSLFFLSSSNSENKSPVLGCSGFSLCCHRHCCGVFFVKAQGCIASHKLIRVSLWKRSRVSQFAKETSWRVPRKCGGGGSPPDSL